MSYERFMEKKNQAKRGLSVIIISARESGIGR